MQPMMKRIGCSQVAPCRFPKYCLCNALVNFGLVFVNIMCTKSGEESIDIRSGLKNPLVQLQDLFGDNQHLTLFKARHPRLL